MFSNKYKESKILNNNLPFINMLLLVTITYLGCFVNYWYFLFYIVLVLSCLSLKINKWQILICVGIIAIFVPLFMFANQFSLFTKLANWLGSNIVRNSIFNYLDSIYSEEISSFIKLILFGVKSESSYIFYKQTVDLGIVWLISVGGFHISFLSRLIYKCLKKVWKIGKWFDIGIILIYSYLLRFSYSSMRVLFMLILNPFFKRFKIESYNKLGFVGLLFSMLNPSCLKSYSFLLSFLGVTSAYFINSLNIENKLINSILIGVSGFVITIPFVIALNHKISLLTFVNSFIFAYLFAFIFIYFLIFAWMPFMVIIHKWIIIACYAIMGNISYLNIYIKSDTWPIYFVFIYYLCLYAIYKLLYLIVLNNKI